MGKNGFVPILLLIPIAIVSLVSISLITFKNNPNNYHDLSVTLKNNPASSRSLQPSQVPSPSPTPSPSPSPTPTPSPSPSTSPSPKPSTAPSGSRTSLGANYTLVTYDLGSSTVITDSASDDDCSNNCPAKPLAEYVAENGGKGGMNGTYFCPPDYSWCSSKINTFDFPIWNNRKKKWLQSDKLFWSGRGMMVFRSGSAQFFPNAAAAGAPSDITGGIVNYPSLVSGGKLILDEGSLSDNQKTKGTRSGIGFGNGKLYLVVASSADMKDLAGIFLSLGATDALNLDGGGSVALYSGGYKIGPGRNIPNALIVK